MLLWSGVKLHRKFQGMVACILALPMPATYHTGEWGNVNGFPRVGVPCSR